MMVPGILDFLHFKAYFLNAVLSLVQFTSIKAQFAEQSGAVAQLVRAGDS